MTFFTDSPMAVNVNADKQILFQLNLFAHIYLMYISEYEGIFHFAWNRKAPFFIYSSFMLVYLSLYLLYKVFVFSNKA